MQSKEMGVINVAVMTITSKIARTIGTLAILIIALAIVNRNNTMPIERIKEKLDMKAPLNNHSKQ